MRFNYSTAKNQGESRNASLRKGYRRTIFRPVGGVLLELKKYQREKGSKETALKSDHNVFKKLLGVYKLREYIEIT